MIPLMPIVGFCRPPTREYERPLTRSPDALPTNADSSTGINRRRDRCAWLAHAQALCGQLDHTHAAFERAIAHTNDVGLLAEEIDLPPMHSSATFRRRSATSRDQHRLGHRPSTNSHQPQACTPLHPISQQLSRCHRTMKFVRGVVTLKFYVA